MDDLLQRGHHWSGGNAGAAPPPRPVNVGPRDNIDYNANNTDKGVYSSSDPYQQRENQEGEEEEAMLAERDLAEDAQWKRIQQNTFTRWANEHLKIINFSISNLETQLSDGLLLIALIEVLSGRPMSKHNKRPLFRSQKLENVSVALKFLEKEGLKIINIDSTDIVDCKLKLILGLIWTLILHYSISMPMWDDDGSAGPTNMTPKQRLMNWIQKKVPDHPISNFTNDWADGKAVGALVDACAPGLCPDWPTWDPKDALQNATEAMGLADDYLNVRPLITPEELISPKIDEQSMMTYLSQYPNAQLKPGAPLRAPANPNRVRAYGPGIEPTGNVVGAPANFTVETFSAGKGQVDITVLNPSGAKEPVDVRFNNDKNLTYSVSYTPKLQGPHKVFVKYCNRDIPKSPYTVNVDAQTGDASLVTASGPGLQSEGVVVNRPTYFDISTKNAGKGVPEVIILDPEGQKQTVPAKVRQIAPDLWRCEYIPKKVGLHSVNVFFASKQIPNSPYGVKIAPVSDPKKIRAAGRGLQPNGVRVGDDNATFNIYTDGAGEGVPVVRIIGPGGVNYNVQMHKVDGSTFECKYIPLKEGRYRIMITYGGGEIPKSPFDVNVRPKIQSNVVAYGPGLRGGIVNYPAIFTVDTNGEPGNLGFSIAGPSQAEIQCRDNEDGSCFLTYLPTAPGDYAVHVLMNEEDIPNSPFMAKILPRGDFDPNKVKSSGPGLKPTGVTIDKPAEFKVDTRDAGDAPLEVRVTDCFGTNVPVQISQVSDGTKKCVYVPKTTNPHTIEVNYGNVPTPNSPYRVKITAPLNPAKVQAFGPWLEPGVRPGQTTHFNVDARDAGDAELQVEVVNDNTKKPVPTRIIDNGDNTYAVEVTPTDAGTYTTNLFYGGLKVPTSPKTSVQPQVDVSKVKVDGLEPTAPINSLQQFRVITEGIPKADLAVTITSPSGHRVKAHVIPTAEGFLVNFTPTQLGEYLLSVSFGGTPITQHPFRIQCLVGCDTRKVSAEGPGLSHGVIGRPAQFMIDTRGAGQGGLGVTVEGPCEAAINCRDNGDGTCNVAYLPTEAGDFTINITFNDKHISGSPFQAIITPEPDLSNIKVSGLGIQSHGVIMNAQTEFSVDMKSIKTTKTTIVDSKRFTCQIIDPKGNMIPSKILSSGNSSDIIRIMYTPFEAGPHTIELLYDNVAIPGSPFVVVVKAGCDPTRVRAFGPGLQGGVTNLPAKFTVETKGAGTGGLSLAIEGPSEAKMTCIDKRDGSCDVEYLPTEPGEYDITVRFAEKHIPGSPFKVNIQESPGASRTKKSTQSTVVDAKKVRVYGQGVTQGQVHENMPVEFFVDAGDAGPGKIGVKLTSTDGKQINDLRVSDKGDGIYAVTFTAPRSGAVLTCNVLFSDKEVPGSPFIVTVGPRSDVNSVKVSGDLTKKKVPASVPVKFRVDNSKAGSGDLSVQITYTEIHEETWEFYGTTTSDQETEQLLKTFEEKKKEIHSRILEKAKLFDKTVDQIQKDLFKEFHEEPEGRVVETKIREVQPGVKEVSFVPDECGPYNIAVKHGGTHVNGSPFVLQSFPTGDAEKCTIVEMSPDELEYGTKNKIIVDARAAGPGAVTCKITNTDNNTPVDVEIIENKKMFDVYYVLNDPGDYDIDIKFGGRSIPDGAFSLKAGEKQQKVKSPNGTSNSSNVQNTSIKEEYSFTEAASKTQDFLEHLKQEEYEYREERHKKQYVENKNNNHSGITNGKHDKTDSYSLNDSANFRQVQLNKLLLPHSVDDLEAEIKMPSGEIDKPIIEDNRDGTVSVKYDPREEGLHELSVRYNGEHVQGSPFKFHVDSISSGYVTAYGSGLTHGVSGEPAQFIISTKGAGAGGLSMAVEGPSKADIKYHDNKDGTVSVSYLPTAPGEYKVSVRFGDKHIKGSPFFAKITGEGRKRNQISVGACSEVSFPGEITDNDLKQLNASISAPTGLEEPCFLKRLPSGNIGISFTPREVGEHIVSVKRLGGHIPNSPFKVQVLEREVGDAKKVKTGGTALAEGKTHIDNFFTVDTRNAGFGGLSLSIEGPSKAEINCTDQVDGTLNISYKPTEPGYYIVNLKFADHHVEGSPFTVKVSGEGTNRQREKIQRQRDPPPASDIGSQCKLTFKMPGITSFDLSAQVTSPGFVTEDAVIAEVEDGLYAVEFTPKELGVHTVSVRYKGIHIPGSPFQFTVGPLRDFGSHLVKAGGSGLEYGEVGVPSIFNVWTREAGSGSLAISVEGPSKALIDFKDRKDGSCDVSYTVQEPGEYRVGLKFNDRHIPDSPFKVYISPAMGEAHKLEIAQFPEGGVLPDKPAQFFVRTNHAKGKLDAKVVAPSNSEDDCFIQMVDPDQYSIRFYPRENGIHAIHVKFNGVHIPGSPFRIIVGKGDADPAAVHAEGAGLQQVRTGTKTDFIIDTCNAGSGTLQVTIDGPSKVSMDCTEVEDGYKVRYTPLLSGDYYITVKYNHMHIVGSPFKISCTGKSDKLADLGAQETSTVTLETIAKISKVKGSGAVLPVFRSDASKVVSKGMGLKKAYCGKQNQFNINTGDAGNNILYVGIYGPKLPVDEVHVKHAGRGVYNVNYMVKDRGDYIVIVKWGEDHIPGSPFKVEC